MKTIGLIGGTSFESTITYYQTINKTVNTILGGQHSAKCILYSLDFHDIESNVMSDQWDIVLEILTNAAITLEKAGADFIVVCTNTLHKLVPDILKRIHIPILHIAELTANVLIQNNITRVGLLGTKPTMVLDFYKKKLTERGIDIVIPSLQDIEVVNSIIFNELCHGVINKESKQKYISVIQSMYENGAQGVILGCTEIGLLVQQQDTEVPLFDTALIHAEMAAKISVE